MEEFLITENPTFVRNGINVVVTLMQHQLCYNPSARRHLNPSLYLMWEGFAQYIQNNVLLIVVGF